MIPSRLWLCNRLLHRSSILSTTISKRTTMIGQNQPNRGKKDDTHSITTSLFQPVPIKPNSDDINVGAELTTSLKKTDLLKILNSFMQKKEVKALATEYGLDKYLCQEAFNSFRRYCVEAESLPVDLHVVISDVLQGAGHVSNIFPYFMRHAKEIFPHIDCLDDLKKISDLRTPANWYPVARSINRKIIFHAGPTNSGKTYHALERFMAAKSGVYCGPLKLLAAEVFNKSNLNVALVAVEMIEAEENLEVRRHARLTKQQLRDVSDPFHISEELFRKHYRMVQWVALDLIERLIPFLPYHPKGVPPHLQVLAVLRFLAEGGYQKGISQDYNHPMSQSSISKYLHAVIPAIQNLSADFIKFPTTEEEREVVSNLFQERLRFPGVLGLIDCTLIGIHRPTDHEEAFLDHHQNHSLNVQVGTPCDLITGEERRYAKDENNSSQHTACTVEMMALNSPCEVAVIDEIQLIKDLGRGWAWTRALLGIPANEVHLCGEFAAIDLVKSLCSTIGENVEVRKYKRLTELEVEDTALCSLKNVQPGDCIVCFSKNDIYTVSRNLEQQNIEVAVIYGSLPPTTKLAQAAKFNDMNHCCKVLIATDAIGMGLNLHIRRIIFYSLIKPSLNKKGEREMDTISVSSALQIAGRAGRYGTRWEKGYVTTFKPEDLSTLKNLLSQTPEIITQAGLHPTADQIELYAYHLPKAPLSNLMDIFVSLSTVDDSMYFMCNIDDFKFLADMIEHIPLPLRARYVFCCAPINRKLPFVCTMFLKFARQYCKNETITFNWLCQHIGWPLTLPKTLIDLVHLEAVFDVLDLYLWLSYRFSDLFPDINMVHDMQKELDAIIQESVYQLTKLLANSELGMTSAVFKALEEDNFELNTQKNNYLREPLTENIQINYKGKLTERLLAQGLLTPSMLQELHHEWTQKIHKNIDADRTSRRKFTRKPK